MYSRDILDLLNKYNKTDNQTMKENLKKECVKLYDNYGGRQGIAKLIGLELNTFQSCLNPSHKSTLTFENLIKLCGTLNIDINTIFEPAIIEKNNRGASKIWTIEKKDNFINMYEKEGLEKTCEEFNLTNKTAQHYYNMFSKERSS